MNFFINGIMVIINTIVKNVQYTFNTVNIPV